MLYCSAMKWKVRRLLPGLLIVQVWLCCSVTWPTSPSSARAWPFTGGGSIRHVTASLGAWPSRGRHCWARESPLASLVCAGALLPDKKKTTKVCARSSPAEFCPTCLPTEKSAWPPSSCSSDTWRLPSSAPLSWGRVWCCRTWCWTPPTTTSTSLCRMSTSPSASLLASSSTSNLTIPATTALCSWTFSYRSATTPRSTTASWDAGWVLIRARRTTTQRPLRTLWPTCRRSSPTTPTSRLMLFSTVPTPASWRRAASSCPSPTATSTATQGWWRGWGSWLTVRVSPSLPITRRSWRTSST